MARVFGSQKLETETLWRTRKTLARFQLTKFTRRCVFKGDFSRASAAKTTLIRDKTSVELTKNMSECSTEIVAAEDN